MPGDRLLFAQGTQHPVAGGLRVGHRLEGGEGLRRDDEQRLGRIEVAGRLDEVGAVDVRDEAAGHLPLTVVPERLVGHDRPQVRAADADVDHVADAPAREPRPGAAAHAVGEVGHLVEHGVDLGDHVLAVDDDRGAARRAQRDVEDGPLLGDVLEHRHHQVLGDDRVVGELTLVDDQGRTELTYDVKPGHNEKNWDLKSKEK